MLDLNVDAISVEPKTFLESDSAASSSSVVLAADEESNSSTTLRFPILKNDQILDDHENDIDQEELQLFPVRRDDSLMLRPQHQHQQHWLNLSVPEMGFQNKAPEQVAAQPQQTTPLKKSRRGPRSKSSQYRGVTFYRRTGRWESHIWDCGKQVYLGGFDTAHAAARAYDRVAIKFRGIDADINFQISDYEEDMKQMKNLTKEEFVRILRRQSTGFSRGSSKYRGATLHNCGRWEARMDQLLDKKAYDQAAIKFNGRDAVTNFEPNSRGGDQITRAGKNEGGGDNLDLNLWISPNSAGPHETDNSRNLDLHFATSELPDGKRLKVESSLATSHGLAMASKSSVVWTSMFSGFAPNNEETRNMKSEAIPLPAAFSNWPLKFHHNGIITSVPLCSSAASSGFSSPTNTAYSPAFLSPNPSSKVANTFDIRYPPVTLNYN